MRKHNNNKTPPMFGEGKHEQQPVLVPVETKSLKKQEKARTRATWELKRSTRDKCRFHDRNFKTTTRTDNMFELHNEEVVVATNLSEGDLKLIRVGRSAAAVLNLIEKRTLERMQSSWQTVSITFLCCVKFGGILSRDVARYLLQKFVRPLQFRVDFTTDGLLCLHSPSGVIRESSPPPLSFFPKSKAWDDVDKELWLFGPERDQVMVYEARSDAWRVVTNKDVLDFHNWSITFPVRVDYHWCGDVLWTYSDPFLKQLEAAFSCANEARRLLAIDFLPALSRKQVRNFQKAISVPGGFLFALILNDECYAFPKVVDSNCCCWYCGGSEWTRPSLSTSCCVSLQVLLPTDDLGFGWTRISAPNVHYSSLHPPKFFLDNHTLVLQGGKQRIHQFLERDGEVDVEDVVGEWRFDLIKKKWKHSNILTPFVEGMVIEFDII